MEKHGHTDARSCELEDGLRKKMAFSVMDLRTCNKIK